MPVARANGKLSWVASFSAVIGFVVWVSLPTGGLPGRWFVVLAVPLWLWLVYRAWTLSATLTPDALIARGLLSAIAPGNCQ
jgi:hypothetical protein